MFLFEVLEGLLPRLFNIPKLVQGAFNMALLAPPKSKNARPVRLPVAGACLIGKGVCGE